MKQKNKNLGNLIDFGIEKQKGIRRFEMRIMDRNGN